LEERNRLSKTIPLFQKSHTPLIGATILIRDMTKLLEKAVTQTERLPLEEQNRIAEWLLAELEDEAQWDAQFSGSLDVLERLTKEALSESNAGRTKSLTPDLL
jgi:hypothetical protein